MEIKNNKLFVQEGNYIPDVEFDINTISQLSFSYINVDEAYLLNELEENEKAKEFLNLIFDKKENYIDEYV